MAQGRKEEAEKILQKAAKVNKVELPENVTDKLQMGKETGKTYTLLDVLKRWSFAKISINVWFNWYVGPKSIFKSAYTKSKL